MQGKLDLLKSGNFSIVLKNQKRIELLVQEVSLPGVSLGQMQMSHFTQNFQWPGDHIEWNPLSLTVLCDENLEAYKEVLNHILTLKDPETGDIDKESAMFDAILMITTNKNNSNHIIRFEGCWFQTLGDLMLSATTSEDDTLTFTADVIYTRWFFE